AKRQGTAALRTGAARVGGAGGRRGLPGDRHGGWDVILPGKERVSNSLSAAGGSAETSAAKKCFRNVGQDSNPDKARQDWNPDPRCETAFEPLVAPSLLKHQAATVPCSRWSRCTPACYRSTACAR